MSSALPTEKDDAGWMARALRLAEQAIGVSEPNPRVGCVLVAPNGQLIGEGHTQPAGQAHAEVMALRAALQRGASTRGATAYVTLEPCAHHGRTPPCCDALIAAGLARVVVAVEDPNPRVAGGGLARLREAGLVVELGLSRVAAEALNIGFLHRMRNRRPWVRMKWASSLDGRTALADGRSQWITGPQARHDGHAWRRRAGAVLTGIGTLLADDPRLDVRGWPTQCQPMRVVLDGRLRTPPHARLLPGPGKALVIHAVEDAEGELALRRAGADTWRAPQDPQGRIDLSAVLDELGRREINELHIEAGTTLNGAWLSAGLVDELLIYLAPRLIGPGLGVAELPALTGLDEAQRWHLLEAGPIDGDLRLRLQRPGPPRVST